MPKTLPISPTGILNDWARLRFLAGLPQPHRLMATQGVQALSEEDQREVIRMVLEFQDFNEDNDPYGDHDLCVINYKGIKYYGKMDHYDLKLEFHSDDSSDDQKTIRVLTVMEVSEY